MLFACREREDMNSEIWMLRQVICEPLVETVKEKVLSS